MSSTQVTIKVCSCPSTKFKGKCRCDTTVTLTEKNGVYTDPEKYIWNKGNGQMYTKTTEKYVEPFPTVPKDNINLCFVGGVSTGKSTILNAIFSEQLTQCKIKRTTMVPTIYIENPDHWNPFDKADATDRIYTTISQKNKEIIELTERGIAAEYSTLIFNVGKLDINILEDSFVNVYDIPGLNDARTKDVYYKYLDDNFHNFNLMILLVVRRPLNSSPPSMRLHRAWIMSNFITRDSALMQYFPQMLRLILIAFHLTRRALGRAACYLISLMLIEVLVYG